MARRSREDSPGSWHHVINRGIAKRPLFERREDMRFFLARLARQVRLGRIEVHAYCLMTTHFHMLVRSPLGEMSEGWRQVQNAHSRRFNREHRRDGPLIRGRYFSRPVDSLRYRRVLVSYIDANPVQAGMAACVGDWEHCSARDHKRGRGSPWLCRSWIEAEVGDASRETFWTRYGETFHAGDRDALTDCRDLVEARWASRATQDPIDDLVGAAPEQVRTWMQSKSALADGHQTGLPVCTRLALRRALDESLARDGVWSVRDGDRTRRGEELAWIGLLRVLCGVTWDQMAALEACSSSRLVRLGTAHERLVALDEAHGARTSEIARSALVRVFRA